VGLLHRPTVTWIFSLLALAEIGSLSAVFALGRRLITRFQG